MGSKKCSNSLTLSYPENSNSCSIKIYWASSCTR